MCIHSFSEAEHGHSPVLWLDKVCPCPALSMPRGARPASSHASPFPRWQACIDQQNISASLACLPVYLSGCKELLILAGPTYASRLWCVMEIFVFVRSSGNRERMRIMLALLPHLV